MANILLMLFAKIKLSLNCRNLQYLQIFRNKRVPNQPACYVKLLVLTYSNQAVDGYFRKLKTILIHQPLLMTKELRTERMKKRRKVWKKMQQRRRKRPRLRRKRKKRKKPSLKQLQLLRETGKVR